MEANLIHKIFGRKEPLNRSDLQNLLDLQNDCLITNNRAAKLLQSDFESDALDGFIQQGLSVRDLDQLDARFKKAQGEGISGDAFNFFFLSTWFIGLACVFFLAYFLNKTETIASIKLVTVEPQILEVSENDKDYELDFAPSIEYFSVPNSISKANSTAQLVENTSDDVRQDVPLRMEQIQSDLILSRAKVYNIRKPRAKEVILANYIFIDYRGLRRGLENIEDINLSGTPANAAHANNMSDDDQIVFVANQVEITYHDYLKETAIILEKGNISIALKRFEIILSNYSNDENALFYLAYCQFKMKKYIESLEYLTQLKQAAFGNFDEECDWYMLRCYQKLQRYSEADKLAESIVERGGFYSEQARDFLKRRL